MSRTSFFYARKSKNELKKEDQSTSDSNKEKCIYARDKRIYVLDEVYRVYKKEINHKAHSGRLDIEHGVFYFGNFNIGAVDIADKSVDIKKVIGTRMLIENLRCTLNSSNEEGGGLIELLYLSDKTLMEVVKQRSTNPVKVSRLGDKILEKLRKLLDKQIR